jgi:hypothetical protein
MTGDLRTPGIDSQLGIDPREKEKHDSISGTSSYFKMTMSSAGSIRRAVSPALRDNARHYSDAGEIVGLQDYRPFYDMHHIAEGARSSSLAVQEKAILAASIGATLVGTHAHPERVGGKRFSYMNSFPFTCRRVLYRVAVLPSGRVRDQRTRLLALMRS